MCKAILGILNKGGYSSPPIGPSQIWIFIEREECEQSACYFCLCIGESLLLNVVQILLRSVVDESDDIGLLIHGYEPSTDRENCLDVQNVVGIKPLHARFDG